MNKEDSFSSAKELQQRLQKVSETISLIDRNLQSDALYEDDRSEIEKSRQFFERQRQELKGQLDRLKPVSAV